MKIVMFIVITEISQQNDADLCFYKYVLWCTSSIYLMEYTRGMFKTPQCDTQQADVTKLLVIYVCFF